MSRKVIIQIGRLDTRYREEISFSYMDEKGKSELSSKFLKKTKEFKEADLLLIFPKSIIFQDNLIENKNLIENDSFIKIIKETPVKSYFDDCYSILSKHPHLNPDDNLFIVDSFGNFKFKENDISLESNLSIITLQIYTFIILHFSKKETEEINIDISSGQNIYISALLSALYRFIPFIKFRRYLSSDYEKISSFILSSDPIIPGNNLPIKIQKSEFKARAFNSFTYKNSLEAGQLIKLVFKEQSYYKELYEFIDNQYFILHGSFVYGIPMMLMLLDHGLLEVLFRKIGLDNILKDLLEFTISEKMNKEIKDESLLYSITYALALGEFIFNNFEKIIKEKEIVFEIDKEKKTMNNQFLKDKSEFLHRFYGQPESNYLNELNMLYSDYVRIEPTEKESFISGAQIKNLINPTYIVRDTFNPRNYFAHMGCELNCTEIIEKDNKILVRYNDLINEKSILKFLKK